MSCDTTRESPGLAADPRQTIHSCQKRKVRDFFVFRRWYITRHITHGSMLNLAKQFGIGRCPDRPLLAQAV